jgi:hypothetical protein
MGASFTLLALWPSMSIRESLWIDELHSTWVISSGWDEVIQRASMGNQSPLYFFCLKAWSSIFEAFRAPDSYGEGILRLSSLLGWMFFCCVSLATIFRTVPLRGIPATGTVIVTWLLLDRIGAFYAIELRPYIWVALMGLGMMLSGANIANAPDRLGSVWIAVSALAFYFHYTAIIIVLLSWFAIVVAIAVRWPRADAALRQRIVRMRAIEWSIMALLLLPGIYRLVGITNKSQQWASFAGDASLAKVVDLFPWIFWTLIPLVVFVVERIIQLRKNAFSSIAFNRWFAWLLQLCMVGFGSLLVAWLLTVTETAPLLHRRYLLGAYPAFLLLGAFFLGRIQSRRALLITGAVSAALMVGWQGTATEWWAGRWIAWQRQEDWRGAIDFLNSHRRSDEPIFLVSNLIEARGPRIDTTIDAGYLRYPLTSLYPILDAESVCLLPNERLNWTSEIIPRTARSNNDIGWIIARSQKVSGLEAELNAETIEKREWKAVPVYYGGGVQVWKLESH